jgi:hypothetical protein
MTYDDIIRSTDPMLKEPSVSRSFFGNEYAPNLLPVMALVAYLLKGVEDRQVISSELQCSKLNYSIML